MDKNTLHKQILMDHYNNPKNKVKEAPEGYETRQGINPSCGDELELYIKFNVGKIEDVKFKGEGCSICCSSASILTQEIKEKEIEEIENKINEFSKMLKGEKFDDTFFEDAVAFEGISKFPARYKCAFLAWQTLNDFLE